MQNSVLKQNADILKQCAGVAQTTPFVLSTNAPDFTEQLDAEARSECSQKPLLSIPRVVSCAASSGYCAYACPGSVAAYHGALSRDPPLFEALFAFKGVYNSPNPSRSELVSDKPQQQSQTIQLTVKTSLRFS